jgi:hypothetical protein
MGNNVPLPGVCCDVMEARMRISRRHAPAAGRTALLALMAAGSVLAACSDLPVNEQVRQRCANVPADQRQACEDAEYQRLYAIEKAQNRRIAYP